MYTYEIVMEIRSPITGFGYDTEVACSVPTQLMGRVFFLYLVQPINHGSQKKIRRRSGIPSTIRLRSYRIHRVGTNKGFALIYRCRCRQKLKIGKRKTIDKARIEVKFLYSNCYTTVVI